MSDVDRKNPNRIVSDKRLAIASVCTALLGGIGSLITLFHLSNQAEFSNKEGPFYSLFVLTCSLTLFATFLPLAFCYEISRRSRCLQADLEKRISELEHRVSSIDSEIGR